MRLGAGRDPRVEERLRGVSGSCGNEFVGRLTKRTVCTEGDRAEAYVEPLFVVETLMVHARVMCKAGKGQTGA